MNVNLNVNLSEFCEISKNTFSIEHFRATASVNSYDLMIFTKKIHLLVSIVLHVLCSG